MTRELQGKESEVLAHHLREACSVDGYHLFCFNQVDTTEARRNETISTSAALGEAV